MLSRGATIGSVKLTFPKVCVHIYLYHALGLDIDLAIIDMEPLLMESKRRFVLFPIKYHEVSTSTAMSLESLTDASTRRRVDLANVQEG